MATIPSWVNPPDYLRAMSSGANLGLNVRQQGFNERMSIEQLRQDQVRQALAVEQLRAAEMRAREADRLRALQFQAQEQRFGQELGQQKAALDLRTRQQDFEEDMAMLPAAMTPYQEASLGLREQISESKPDRLSDQQKAEKWILESEINALESELARNPMSPETVLPRLDSAKKRYREMFMAPEELESTRKKEKLGELTDMFSKMNPNKQRALLPVFNRELEALGAPGLPEPGLPQASLPVVPPTNQAPSTQMKIYRFNPATGKIE